MKDHWLKIKKWLTDNHPEVLSTLNPGASKNDFDHLEKIIGTSLPHDFKEFYSIHNGQTNTHLRLFNGDILLSIQHIINEWQLWKDVLPSIVESCIKEFGLPAESTPDSGIKNDWWNPYWIPFTADGSGDHYCIDLDPTDEGQKGQVIRLIHDDPQRILEAPSFKHWIYNYVRDLESNVYEASDEIGCGGVIRKE